MDAASLGLAKLGWVPTDEPQGPVLLTPGRCEPFGLDYGEAPRGRTGALGYGAEGGPPPGPGWW